MGRIQHLLACGASEAEGHDSGDAGQRPTASSSAKHPARRLYGEDGTRARAIVRQHGATWPCRLSDGRVGRGDYKWYVTLHHLKTVTAGADHLQFLQNV